MITVDESIFFTNLMGVRMSHIDTLKVYEEYRAAGFDEKTAKELTNVLESSFTKIHKSLFEELKQWLKEAKEDFASQKLISILGGLILLALTTSIGLLWNLTVDFQILKSCGIVLKESK
jgi:hypothetical protein